MRGYLSTLLYNEKPRTAGDMTGYAMTDGVYEFDFATTILGLTGKRHCIVGMVVNFTTTATAGNRRLRVGQYDSTNLLWHQVAISGTNHGANVPGIYVIGEMFPQSAAFIGNQYLYMPWTPVWVEDAEALGTFVLRFEGGIAAADTLTFSVTYKI